MFVYTFYRIKELNYVGGTVEFPERQRNYRYGCYNENDRHYSKPLYQFIRENEIPWESLTFDTIETVYLKSLEHSLNVKGTGLNDSTVLITGLMMAK